MPNALGPLEAQFFAFVQGEGLQTVETGDIARALGLTPVQERKLLSRLARSGWIARVRRGLYLVPPTLPPGGKWIPDEALALTTLIEDQEGKYQICGPNTFNRYGWDDQVPNRVYVYNNRMSGDRQIGAVALSLIKVADERLGATETTRTPDGIKVPYSSRVRSLMDAVYDWSRFNGLPGAYDWIRAEISRDETVPADLIRVTLRFGNQGTVRRIGKLLETESVAESLLRKLQRALRPSSSLIPWIPTRPKRGKTDKRWGVVFNDES
jgi:predicted transcriptional regulator of viral defense system